MNEKQLLNELNYWKIQYCDIKRELDSTGGILQNTIDKMNEMLKECEELEEKYNNITESSDAPTDEDALIINRFEELSTTIRILRECHIIN